MEKINKAFFDGEVLICGCSKQDNLYYKNMYKAFTDNGIKVYPMPTTPESELGFETYTNFDDLPKVPNSAYVLTHKNQTPALIEQLDQLGVKRIVFFGKVCADESTLETCRKKGIQTRIGCPMMLFGGGFHRLHAFFAGVKQERA
ncbi:MAG: CoA-binding protein [Gracilibacteraceae bacterium]|jgi:acyl-CoA synthetase (NDP forming)|nr:CoA-binding protein [Gracilibacteraceae bacterium]